MLSDKPITINISIKLIIQILVAFLLMTLILFLIHYKVDAGFMADSDTTGHMTLGCPLKKFVTHEYPLNHDHLKVTEFPNYNLLYFKSGISHWGYLLIGTIIFTLIFQIKLKIRFEPTIKLNEFMNNGQNSKTLEFLVIILSLLAGAYFLYSLQSST